MKIAVISDSHDNLANIKKTLDFLERENVKRILHCGDICAPATLLEIIKNFSGKVDIVFGNVDGDKFAMAKIACQKSTNLKVWGEMAEINLGAKKIAFVHLPEFARGLAASQKYDLVFYGHTHKPWEQKIGKTNLVNPGNLAGLFYQATFAVYNSKTDKLKLIQLAKI